MRTIPMKQLQAAIVAACDSIVASEPLLTRIDSIIGDGDHGTGMRDGFTVLKETLIKNEYSDIYALMREAGLALVKTMGGASGVIFGTLFIAGHEGVRGKTDMDADAIIAFFDAGSVSIAKRGRTAPGDKTMLDALLPAVEAMRRRRQETEDVARILEAGYEGALQGVENTKDMISRKGRSKNFREKTLGVPDPGAISVSLFFKGISDFVNGRCQTAIK